MLLLQVPIKLTVPGIPETICVKRSMNTHVVSYLKLFFARMRRITISATEQKHSPWTLPKARCQSTQPTLLLSVEEPKSHGALLSIRTQTVSARTQTVFAAVE